MGYKVEMRCETLGSIVDNEVTSAIQTLRIYFYVS